MSVDPEKLAEELEQAAGETAGAEDQGEAELVQGSGKAPWDYRGHKTAKAINKRLGDLLGDPDLPEGCYFGEAATQTLEEQAGAASLPGHYWLGLSVLGMALLIGMRLVLGTQQQGQAGQGPVPQAPGNAAARLVPATDLRSGEFSGAVGGAP